MTLPGRYSIAMLASLLLFADSARAYNSEEHKLIADWGASLVQLPPSVTLPFPTRFQDTTLAARRAGYQDAKNRAVGFITNNPNQYDKTEKGPQDNSYYNGYAQLEGNKDLYIPDDAHLRGRTLIVGGVTNTGLSTFTFGELVAIYGDYRRTVYCDAGGCYLTDANTPTLAFEQGVDCYVPVVDCGWRPGPVSMTTYLRNIGSGLWPPYGSCGNATGNTDPTDVTYSEAGWWGDEMLRIAQSNDWHFSSAAVAWYVGMHRLALRYVDRARSDPSSWNQALHYEAHALHSLTDLFAFGHVVTNRDRTSYATIDENGLRAARAYRWMENVIRVGGGSRSSTGKIDLDSSLPAIIDSAGVRRDFLASYTPKLWVLYARQEKDFHDAYNHSGATVRNLKGDTLTIWGDSDLPKASLATVGIMADAVRASLQSLFDAFVRLEAGASVDDIGKSGDAYFAALKSIPVFVESNPSYTYQRPVECNLPGETDKTGHNFDGRWTRYAAFVDQVTGAGVVPANAGQCLVAYEDGEQEIPAPSSGSACTTFPNVSSPPPPPPPPPPPTLALAQSRPNPSTRTGSVVIEYSLAQAEDVRLELFDAHGAPVVVLDEGARAAGPHVVTWDGVDANGHRARPGVYHYRLRVGSQEATRQLVWLR
jgi:hypothetical protein